MILIYYFVLTSGEESAAVRRDECTISSIMRIIRGKNQPHSFY